MILHPRILLTWLCSNSQVMYLKNGREALESITMVFLKRIIIFRALVCAILPFLLLGAAGDMLLDAQATSYTSKHRAFQNLP